MALVYDNNYPLYYSVPNGTQVGVIKFSFNAPIVIGDLVSVIVNSILTPIVASQGGEITRVIVWTDQINTLINKWTTEFHVYFPQAAGLAGTRLFAFIPILAAIWTAIQPYLGWIIGGIISSVVLDKLTTAIYGPVNPNTGNRDQPQVGSMIMVLAVIAVIGMGAFLYFTKYAKRGE